MKKLILFFSMLLAYVSSNAQGVWISQASGFVPTSSGVRNIAVVDTDVVWLSPYDGAGGGFPRQDFSKTIDGGDHWVAGITPAPAVWDYAMIEASSATSAWAVFYNASLSPAGEGLIYHTTDGGATWNQQGASAIYSYPGQSFPNVIHFFDDNNGVIIGDPANGEFEIYTTVDGGTNWVAVPAADIADPDDGDEAGWTTHISTFGDNVWFDTNHGRVYHSSDKGFHWTAAQTNLFIPIPGTIDICFYSATSGIARYYDDGTLNSDIVETSDGGATWSSTFNPTGSFLGAAVEAVPGTDSMLVSTGVSNSSGFTGSSYSTNGGHDWITIDAGTQRNALGIADSLTMWAGGFTTDSTSNGIFKFVVFDAVACNDPLVSAGTTSATDSIVCGSDTVTLTATGVYSPVMGSYSGISWVISKADISGSLDPISEPSLVATYRVTFPAPAVDTREFINDLGLIEGLNYPFGIYYWTPVVFGNATAQVIPVNFLTDLVLDLNCLHVGTSIPVVVPDPSGPCDVGISEIKANQLSVKAFVKDQSTLEMTINSISNGKASIQITDPAGRLVKNQKTQVSSGLNHEVINIEDLATGTYILKTEINGSVTSNKIIKY